MTHVGEFKDLIGRMENLDPQKRATVAEALEHPWPGDSKVLPGIVMAVRRRKVHHPPPNLSEM
ncbi:hypothetical protein PABG_11159 [Paracoccidioides brasiliensis Pb03]|nr:hypothetical protein PABG_11159 [Paracoccidioides brasiliensis Pb03]